ncbi:MAG TPA: hypothetical protein PK431_03245 [Chitinophagales bacterium]|nr:hypothetical protein [Chitinophagales bacterium]
MKLILFITIISLMILSGCANETKTKLKTEFSGETLNGRIKSIEEIIFSAEDRYGKVINGSKLSSCKTEYDRNGEIMSIFQYSDNDNNIVKNVRDIKGKIIERRVYFNGDYQTLTGLDRVTYDLNGKQNLTNIIEYDEKENEIENTKYNSDGSIGNKTISKYDNSGNKTEEYDYDSDGNLYSKTITKYDKNGKEIESNIYDSDDNIESKSINKYDEKGNKIENYYYNNGSLVSKEICKYDNRGNIIESDKYLSSNELFGLDKRHIKYMYKYDTKNRKIEYNSISYKSDGSIDEQNIEKYKYDDKENIIEEYELTNYNIKESEAHKYTQSFLDIVKENNNKIFITKYKYTFDKYGNWITKIQFKNDFPKIITERQIEYYK